MLYIVKKVVEENYGGPILTIMSLDADKPIPIRIPNDLKAKIDIAADKLGWTTQQTMREAMKLGLEFYERIDYNIPGTVLDAVISKASASSLLTTSGKEESFQSDYRSIPPPTTSHLNQTPALEPVILPTTAHEAEMLRKGAAMRKAARSQRTAKPDHK